MGKNGKQVVFVSGPFRAETPWLIEINTREAERVATEIWQMEDVAVICPHANTRWLQGTVSDQVIIDGYLEMVSRCDAVFMVEGWEDSEGANLEYERAIELDIPVFFELEDLAGWLRELS